MKYSILIAVALALVASMSMTGCSTVKASGSTTQAIPTNIPWAPPVVRVESMDASIEYEHTVVEADGYTWTGGFAGKTVLLLDIPLSVVPQYWEQSTDMVHWVKTAPIEVELIEIDGDGIMHYRMTFASIGDLKQDGYIGRQFFRLTYF